jgi:hypothetical protein
MNQRTTKTTSVVGSQLLEGNPLANSNAPLVIPVENMKSPFSFFKTRQRSESTERFVGGWTRFRVGSAF